MGVRKTLPSIASPNVEVLGKLMYLRYKWFLLDKPVLYNPIIPWHLGEGFLRF